MVVHYPRERLRYHSERPTAIRDTLTQRSPCCYRTSDIPLGVPTTQARTSRGLWALYPSGNEAVVTHPDGAIVGPPAEVAAALETLLARDGHDPLTREVVRSMQALLRGDGTGSASPARRWSRPAAGYWLSGPDNAQRRRPARSTAEVAQPRRLTAVDGDPSRRRPREAERPAPIEPLQPAA
jgi:hypothetical protein